VVLTRGESQDAFGLVPQLLWREFRQLLVDVAGLDQFGEGA
jgi:hypothetical protein